MQIASKLISFKNNKTIICNRYLPAVDVYGTALEMFFENKSTAKLSKILDFLGLTTFHIL